MSCHRHRARRVGESVLAALVVSAAAVRPNLASANDYFLADDFGLVQLFANKPTFHVLSVIFAPWTEAIYGIQPDELRPTLALSYQFDSLWGASDPRGYHASSIVFHVISSLLVLFIARRAAQLGLVASALAAVLFAVLPIHPETVVWISGRADSIPTLFYLSAFLCFAVWRRTGAPIVYGLAIGAFVANLFSKQSAITLPFILVAYDVLVLRRSPRPTLAWLSPYLPFLALTVGYLGLRRALFGNAVREQLLTLETVLEFANRQATYVKMLATGSARLGADVITPEQALVGRLVVWVLIVLACAFVLLEVRRVLLGEPTRRGAVLFFGPAWWLTCVAPLVVTYESPRHLYLASAGVCVAVGILAAHAWSSRNVWRRVVTAVAAASLVIGAARMQARAIEAWHQAGSVSRIMAMDLERELAPLPAGSVVVLGAPQFGASLEYHTWLWMWAMPFAAQPPFLPAGLADRVSFIVPPDVYCCLPEQWHASTVQAIQTWATRPDRPPALILRWDAWTGVLDKQTELDAPTLRERLEALGTSPNAGEACTHLLAILPSAHCAA